MEPTGKKIERVRNFHVVGGGCFGTQYVKWLLRAKDKGMIKFEKVIAIDRNPECRLTREVPQDDGVVLVKRDWVDYFSDLLLNEFQNPDSRWDHWVPAPLSPHILFLGFLRAGREMRNTLHFREKIFREDVKTPVQIPLQVGTYAVSFAEWQCPVNCIEPSTCPAIHSTRSWDMKSALTGYFKGQEAFRSFHVLQCRHLVHGVGTIPCSVIFSEFKKMLEDLADEKIREVTVATVSGCHGLIGASEVIRS